MFTIDGTKQPCPTISRAEPATPQAPKTLIRLLQPRTPTRPDFATPLPPPAPPTTKTINQMNRAAATMARRVPGIREVVAGAHVNIVQKQDQRTGREVSGTVQDVLTRGDHPRGIKVRLADGRVGRVQAMARGEAPAPASAVPRTTARIDEDWGTEWASPSGSSYGPQQPRPGTQVGLDAYVKESKPKKRARGKWGLGPNVEDSRLDVAEESGVGVNAASGSSETTTCPVCGEFEGDEAAVSHHVSGHFDS